MHVWPLGVREHGGGARRARRRGVGGGSAGPGAQLQARGRARESVGSKKRIKVFYSLGWVHLMDTYKLKEFTTDPQSNGPSALDRSEESSALTDHCADAEANECSGYGLVLLLVVTGRVGLVDMYIHAPNRRPAPRAGAKEFLSLALNFVGSRSGTVFETCAHVRRLAIIACTGHGAPGECPDGSAC